MPSALLASSPAPPRLAPTAPRRARDDRARTSRHYASSSSSSSSSLRRRRRRVSPRGGGGGVAVAALPPNKEWPPPDVWEDFLDAVSSQHWDGHAITLRPGSGAIVPLPSSALPDAHVAHGVGVNQWVTRTSTAPEEEAREGEGEGARGALPDAFSTTTRYLYPEAGCDFGREDVARERVDAGLCGGGQMGKMLIVDGDYAHGPLVLPACEVGAKVRFEFAFAARAANARGGEPEAKKNPDGRTIPPPPTRRVRIGVTVEASPGSKRNWRASEIELVRESRRRGGGEDADADADAEPEPEKGETLGEDDVATGNWRAVSGVTFLTCESLLSDDDYEEAWLEELEKRKRAEEEAEAARGAAAATAPARLKRGGGGVGRGRVKKGDDKGGGKGKGDATTAATPVVVQGVVVDDDDEEGKETAAGKALRPPPEGLVVVPTWAVAVKAPFTSAHEYVLGPNSPLTLLPMRAWVLVEAIGDELLVECGIYAGRGGLGEDGGWVPAATEGGDSEPRRAAARRYERNGRFASAFFVEESRMTAEELENEKEDGEGGKPLYF